MSRFELLASAILACACVSTIEGVPFEDEAPDAGTTAGSSSGGDSPKGASSASGGTSNGTTTTGGTTAAGSSGASVGGTGIGGAGIGGTGVSGTGTGGTNVAGATSGGVGGAGSAGGGLAGAGGAGSTSGGSASGGAGGTTGPTFAQVSDIIVRACASSMCHGGRRNPNLSAANLYTTLTSTSVRECGNDRLVTARDTANSALIGVVSGKCGELLMPEGCDTTPCIDAADLAIISNWISAGALR